MDTLYYNLSRTSVTVWVYGRDGIATHAFNSTLLFTDSNVHDGGRFANACGR